MKLKKLINLKNIERTDIFHLNLDNKIIILIPVKENFKIPVFVYQVSGEYSLIKNGIKIGILDKASILESIVAFKRAGASAIVTYFALDILRNLNKN